MHSKDSGCAGYKTWTDGGWEYDCEYPYAGDVDCGECIFGGHGGKRDPRKPYRYDTALEQLWHSIMETRLAKALIWVLDHIVEVLAKLSKRRLKQKDDDTSSWDGF